MQAVIKTGGRQYLVKKGQKIKIQKVDQKVGTSINFDNIFLLFDEKEDFFKIGKPILKAQVTGKILEHSKDKKVTIFKYKPKKRYKVKKGHRQPYTLVEITKVSQSSSTKSKKNSQAKKKLSSGKA
jgi:large subunit ribosomal protein L21